MKRHAGDPILSVRKSHCWMWKPEFTSTPEYRVAVWWLGVHVGWHRVTDWGAARRYAEAQSKPVTLTPDEEDRLAEMLDGFPVLTPEQAESLRYAQEIPIFKPPPGWKPLDD